MASNLNFFARFFALSRRKQLVVLIVLALTLFIGLRVYQALTKTSRSKTAETTVVQIKRSEITQLQAVSLDKTLPISGSLNPLEQTLVSARASGEVQSVAVREGQAVSKGQTLAELVATTYQAQYDQARANVASAEQSLNLAQKDYQNNEELYRSGFIAKMALQRLEVALQNARSTLTNAQQTLVIAQRNLAETRINAPISGVIAARKINPGETVGTGSVLFSIVNEDSFEVSAPISAEQVGQIAIGQTVQLRTPGVIDAFTGTVERINPAAQAGSRSFTVYVRVNNTGALRAGMYAQGDILLSSKPNVLSVPASAIHTKNERRYVYVLNNDRIEQREVTLGERASEAADAPTEITSGLQQGESVVRLDLGDIKPEQKVELVENSGQASDTTTNTAASNNAAQTEAPKTFWGKIKAWLSNKPNQK